MKVYIVQNSYDGGIDGVYADRAQAEAAVTPISDMIQMDPPTMGTCEEHDVVFPDDPDYTEARIIADERRWGA